MSITQSGLECRGCGDRIFSNYRHDFVACKCDATFVDGGFDYLRSGFLPTIGQGIAITRELDDYPKVGFRNEGKK